MDEIDLEFVEREFPVSDEYKKKILQGTDVEKLTFLIEENIPGASTKIETYEITLPVEYKIIPITVGKYEKGTRAVIPGRPDMRQVTVIRGLVQRLDQTPRYFILESEWFGQDDENLISVVSQLDKELRS